jgi:bicarbonate transport system permease protein
MMVDPQTTTSQKFWDTKLGGLVLGILGWVIFLGVWQVLSSSEIWKLPGPASVLERERNRELLLYPFYDRGGNDKGLFWLSISDLQQVLMSCSWAGVLGIGLGILLGVNQMFSKLFEPVIPFLQILPPLLLLHFALDGGNTDGLIALDVWIAFWPMLRHTAMGVKQVPEEYRRFGLVVQFSQHGFLPAISPLALPYICTGIRKAVVLTWCLHNSISAFVSGGIAGLGFFISEAYQNNHIDELILALIYVGAIALILDYSQAWIQRKMLQKASSATTPHGCA